MLICIVMVLFGVEVIGIFLIDEGDLFFNVQYLFGINVVIISVNVMFINIGIVGVFVGVNFNNLLVILLNLFVLSLDEEKELVVFVIG